LDSLNRDRSVDREQFQIKTGAYMKSVTKKLLQKIGLNITRFRPEPYEYLLDIPRYEEMVVDLLGQDFKIADSVSFHSSFREIFSQEIYKFNSSIKKPIIVDCGSNYGVSIVYFKSLYPGAKIIGVEADPHIFKLLNSNIKARNYQDVSLINKAVLANANGGTVSFYSEGADGGRVHTIEHNKAKVEVEAVCLDDLFDEQIDFLKIDIEGAETEVICSCTKLDRVSQVFIEYHSFKDSEQTLNAILEKLTSSGFRYYIHTIKCSPRPLLQEELNLGMDLQLNIFANKIS
jgi:FkbM family methyltransferase